MYKHLKKIGDTPLSITIYSVEVMPTHIHEKGVLEIIMCLKGSVKFSYAYEEFILHAGDFVSVDKDAYYLYDGEDNICVSFIFDLRRYEEKYPFICDNLFVCEGFFSDGREIKQDEYSRLKGMLVALLKVIISETFLFPAPGKSDCEQCTDSEVEQIYRQVHVAADSIIDIFVEHFDIFFFHTNMKTADKKLIEKLREVNGYMHEHMKEPLTIKDLARRMNFTEGYMSEYMRKFSVGFRMMMGYIRANASEYYLLKTDKNVLEISEECGFSDPKYYYSAFKRWYKCTPGQFRKQYRSISEEKLEYLDTAGIKGIVDELIRRHYMEMFIPKIDNP